MYHATFNLNENDSIIKDVVPLKSTTKTQLLVLKNYCLSHFHEKSGDLTKLRPGLLNSSLVCLSPRLMLRPCHKLLTRDCSLVCLWSYLILVLVGSTLIIAQKSVRKLRVLHNFQRDIKLNCILTHLVSRFCRS